MSDIATDDPQTSQPDEPPLPDPSDPEAATAIIRQQLADANTRYQQQLETARRAQAETAQVRTQLETAAQDRSALEHSTVANALEAAQARADVLQTDYTAAMEAGDFRKASQLNLEIGRLGARIEQLETGKQALERQRTENLRPVASTPPPQQSEQDRIEADLASRGPEAAAWIRKHADPATGRPRFYTDPAFQSRVIGADSLAVGNGLVRNTPQYFEYIERTVGVAQTPTTSPQRDEPRSVPTSAPSRPAPNYRDNQQRSTGGHIPAEAARFAKQIGVDPADYWKEVQEMDRRNEFKLGNPYARRA